MDIKERAINAMHQIFASRGPNKGKLLASAPKMQSDAYAAWQGAMLVCNPFKASIAGMVFMTEDQMQILNLVESAFRALPGSQWLDRDREALERLGVW